MSDTPSPAIQKRSFVNRAIRQPAGWVGIAVTIICGFEGLYTYAYRDVVGVKTICYGATAADHVDFNRKYTKEECQALLAKDLQKYEDSVEKCVHVAMPPHRHAAIVSFTYNVGGGALCKSSVARELNAGHVQAGCNDLMLYNRAGGRVIKGLTTRRAAERKLCLRND
jgi:lysozyme